MHRRAGEIMFTNKQLRNLVIPLAIDFVKEPPFFSISETHQAKTWYLDPRAPKIEQPEAIRRLREKMRARG